MHINLTDLYVEMILCCQTQQGQVQKVILCLSLTLFLFELICLSRVSDPDRSTLRGYPPPITPPRSPLAIYSQNPVVKLAEGLINI